MAFQPLTTTLPLDLRNIQTRTTFNLKGGNEVTSLGQSQELNMRARSHVVACTPHALHQFVTSLLHFASPHAQHGDDVAAIAPLQAPDLVQYIRRTSLPTHILSNPDFPPPNTTTTSSPIQITSYHKQTNKQTNKQINSNMSVLTRTVVPRFSVQASSLRVAGARTFSTTLVTRKIVPDAVKEPVKKIDRAVSDKLVDGIELGRKYSFPLSPIRLPLLRFSIVLNLPQYKPGLGERQYSSLFLVLDLACGRSVNEWFLGTWEAWL
jgi:hypothetical protein